MTTAIPTGRPVLRKEVGIEQLFSPYIGADGSSDKIKGWGVSTRFRAGFCIPEGVLKGLMASVSWVFTAVLRRDSRLQYWDAAKTQYYSAWLCTKAAIYSPDKTLQGTLRLVDRTSNIFVRSARAVVRAKTPLDPNYKIGSYETNQKWGTTLKDQNDIRGYKDYFFHYTGPVRA